uniref:Syntaxin 5 n=1 Tax=Hucho hucho TaxID=62062 RepID=A0A4W5RE65_9TELE
MVDISNMSGRDCTNEFQSVCRSLQGRQNGVHSSKPALIAIRQHSDFTLMAKRIGKDLSNTRKTHNTKSLFDDKAVEIEELTYIVKQDINSLNKQIAQLQGLVRSRQSQNGKHLQTHSNTIVVSLQSKLASMSNDFKSVLEVRTENLKEQKTRRDHFSQAPATSSHLHACNFSEEKLVSALMYKTTGNSTACLVSSSLLMQDDSKRQLKSL